MSNESRTAGDANPYRRRPFRGAPGDTSNTGTPPRTAAERDAQRIHTGVSWEPSRIRFDGIMRSPTDRARGRFRATLPDLVWNAAALEGNAFTLPEVRTLLEGVTVGGRPLEDQQQILALSAGYNRLDELVADGSFALSKAVSDELHGLIAVHEAIESGHFRGEGQAGGRGAVRLANGGTVEGIPSAELPARFDRTLTSLRSIDDPRERALAYFATATRSQFYFDGNKRTARLMMTGALMSAGYEAVNIPFARRHEFNLALDELFTTDDATQLMAFVADCAAGTPS